MLAAAVYASDHAYLRLRMLHPKPSDPFGPARGPAAAVQVTFETAEEGTKRIRL